MSKVPAGVLAWKHKLSTAMQDRGYLKQAVALNECAEMELLLCCENCGHKKYVVYHCESRICPICSWKLARDRARYADALLHQMKFPKFVTLTMPRWTKNPRDGIKFIRQAFGKLREQKLWQCVRGGCYQIELKQKEDGWHIHIHILMDAPFIPKQKIFSAWRTILGMRYASIDVRACRTKKQRDYVTKYVSKNETFGNDPEKAIDWYEAVKGSRLFGTFGTWYNAKIEELLSPEEWQPFKPACENCGDPNHMFFARDGPFLFRKEWQFVKGSFMGDWPESRPCTPEIYQPDLNFLEGENERNNA